MFALKAKVLYCEKDYSLYMQYKMLQQQRQQHYFSNKNQDSSKVPSNTVHNGSCNSANPALLHSNDKNGKLY